MVEWIEHPPLMLEVRGLNPGHTISKNNTSLPETKWLFGARCVEPILYWGLHLLQTKNFNQEKTTLVPILHQLNAEQ